MTQITDFALPVKHECLTCDPPPPDERVDDYNQRQYVCRFLMVT